MNLKYYLEAEKALKQKYNINLLEDVLLGNQKRVILYADITNKNSVDLSVIFGSLSIIGLEDQPHIKLSKLLSFFDYNNKYAEVSGNDIYKDYVYKEIYTFEQDADISFPIRFKQKRIWIRLNAFRTKDERIRLFYLSNVTELLNQQELIYEKTHKDSLTKLLNKYSFDYHYGLRVQRENAHLLYLDLDDFKHINDKLGHHVGDEYLIEFSNILKSFETDMNKFYRIGGDEFLGLLFLPEEEIRKVAEQILDKTRAICSKTLTTKVTVSIGIIKSLKGIDLAKHADKLLYEVKRTGKNHYLYAHEPVDD